MGMKFNQEYDRYRTNEDGEREYHLVDSDEWMTAEDIKELNQEERYWTEKYPKELNEDEDGLDWSD